MGRKGLVKAGARGLCAMAALLAAWPVAAQWTGKGEAGLALASGNTETTTANARIALAYKSDGWETDGALGGLYVRNAGDTTAKRWDLGTQTRYNYSTSTYWYGGGRYGEDRFSGFDHQGVVNTGVGHHFVANNTTKLTSQIGVGYKYWETLANTDGTPAGRDDSTTGVGRLDFEHKLSDTTTVFNKFGAEITSDNNFLQNEAGVAVRVAGRMSLAVAYALRHNTNPPEGFRKTDRLSTVNLLYEVK